MTTFTTAAAPAAAGVMFSFFLGLRTHSATATTPAVGVGPATRGKATPLSKRRLPKPGDANAKDNILVWGSLLVKADCCCWCALVP